VTPLTDVQPANCGTYEAERGLQVLSDEYIMRKKNRSTLCMSNKTVPQRE